MCPDKDTRPRFECTKCGACCSHEQLIVTVTGTDILRLSKALGLDASQMMRALDFYVLNPDDTVPPGLAHIPSAQTESGTTYIALRKTSDGKCVFLDQNLCIVHPFRPDACRSFPFFFRKRGDELTWGLSAMRDICPGLGRGPVITAKELIDLAKMVTQHLEEYYESAADWDSQSREHTALDLVQYLMSK